MVMRNTWIGSSVRYFLTIIFYAAFFSVAFSQQPERATFWYFGENAGLDFSEGNPTAQTNGAMKAFEGCASISDKSGNLLFYTNGGTVPFPGGVWNRQHQLMPNGDLTGTGGCGSSFQSSLIVPHPKYHDRLFYMFTTDCIENNSAGGLRYSIIDLSLDGGLGDVVTKDVLLTTPVDESLTAIQHANGKDYWIVAHKQKTDSFYVYHLSQDGITGLVKTKIGPVTPDYAGALVASANGEKLAYAGLTFTALFDFNRETGEVLNHVDLQQPGYSACFSPDCKLLYVADGVNRNLYQFDILNPSPASTKDQVGTTASTGFGSMQLGPDGKIYVARFVSSTFLGVILNPNLKSDECQYLDDGIYLAGRLGKGGLPNFLASYTGECNSYPAENESNYDFIRLDLEQMGNYDFSIRIERETENELVALLNKKGTTEWTIQHLNGHTKKFDALTPSTTYQVRVMPVPNHENYELLTGHFTDAFVPSVRNSNVLEATTSGLFDFSLSPNPAGNNVTVSVSVGGKPTTLDIYIMEMSGKIISAFHDDAIMGTRDFRLPIEHLGNGVYHIAVQTEETFKVQKLVVLK